MPLSHRISRPAASHNSRLTATAQLDTARAWLRTAQSVAVLTGAGISAESGVPTFRDPGGLWQNYRPEDLATPEAFQRDPLLVWKWYDWRRSLIADCRPNLGHYALRDIEQRVAVFTLITQNVDGLHERAGSQRVLKIHGDIWWVTCLQCEQTTTDLRTPLPELPPRCPCGGMLRPGVVWFSESLPKWAWQQAEEAVKTCEVLIVAGASAVVYPAASLAPLALASGARVIEINTEETPLSGAATCFLRGPSGELLPLLID